MSTRSIIINLGDELIRTRGYNAFSFSDISKVLNIKNASIHYHFKTKTDLGLAVVKSHQEALEQLKNKVALKSPLIKLKTFFSIYDKIKGEDKVCVVGSLVTDLYTVEPEIRLELENLAKEILAWVEEILVEGKQKNIFRYSEKARDKALMIVSLMLASVQITRLTQKGDYELIKENIIKDLKAEK